jgi:MurNAc alpha-1-phosphate uridylyltransferase
MLPVVILAGGFGTRLYPLTQSIPKSMVKINGIPFIDYQLKLLAKQACEEVILCVSYKSELIQDFVGDGSRYGLAVKYSHDGRDQLGTGGAIVKALPSLGENFIVLYGDSFLPTSLKTIAEAHLHGSKSATMAVFFNDNNYATSNVLFSNGVLKFYSKTKPNHLYTHIDYGVTVFKKSIFKRYAREQNLDLADICSELSATSDLAGYEVFERFYEVGSPTGIQDFLEFLRSTKHVI